MELSWLKALFLGIVQGLTEFLPVSSSGHLAVFQNIMLFEGENLTFAILVHAATVLSILTVFGNELTKLFKGLFKFEWNRETRYILKLLISAVPVAIIGLLFKKYVEALFGNGLILVSIMFLCTAGILTFSHYSKPLYKHKQKHDISFKDALIIGAAQAVAIFPGLSRSGITIATGIFLGNKKPKVAKFSFLMLIIPILGQTFLDLIKGSFSLKQSGIPVSSLLIGFLSAYISGALACKWMMNLVKRGKLINFAIYCMIAAIVAFAFHILIISNTFVINSVNYGD